ncbi:MAG TPA: amidohydrolase family protein [Myxococcaceae bacterium]|jgi:predicted amidohydrolase YtcJ
MRGTRLTRWLPATAVVLGLSWAGGCRLLLGPGKDKAADKIYVNGTIVTMDESGTVAQCVAIKGATITCVESGATCCKKVRGRDTEIVDLEGATVLPGFIDSHSHMAGFGLLNDPDHWIDISSVNVTLKPPPGDPRCKDPNDYQHCFIPVKNQDEVVERLKRGLPEATDAGFAPILGFNYDPSRLGHSKSCKGTGVAFQCTNFEDGTARLQLDKISTTRPVLIDSESGHITYVNGKLLETLDICAPGAAPRARGDAGTCRTPLDNPVQEAKLAKLGQLDEDLSFAAVDAMVGETLGKDKIQGTVAAIHRAAALYSANGFTTVQEGTTSPGLMAAYALASVVDEKFPVTARVLLYETTTNDLGPLASKVPELKLLQNPKLQIAGLKAFADGSTQGFTGFLTKPYAKVWAPFNNPGIFTQPYKGLPDVDADGLAADFLNAHKVGLPLMVHQNGDAAIADVLAALPQPDAAAAPGDEQAPRDLMIHFAMATPDDVKTVGARGMGMTFLTPDLYFYGQPMCRQILGLERTQQLYPAGDAVKAGVRFGLHSDTPVTPPMPLFMIWTAKTRKTQLMPWYERDPLCPEVMGPEQAITILQGVKAFTTDAAWLYGLESTLGSIEVGKTADMVQLSANPLSMEEDPDQLKTIRVLGTIHHGRAFPNPDADLPPIWPG